MTKTFDAQVAIVGGGLTGLSLAIQLNRQGVKVILFEKDKYPFHRVCGEYISMESWEFIKSLGIDLDMMELPIIKKLIVSSPNGNHLTHIMPEGGFGISRYTLDFKLAEIARKEGIDLRDNTRVDKISYINNGFEIQAGGDTIFSLLAVGAFGKRSNLDIKLNRSFIKHIQPPEKNYIGVKYHILTDLQAHTIELHNFKDGYCGVSKVDGNKYCLCYLTTAKNLQGAGSIKNMEEKVLMKNKFIRTYFNEATFLFDSPVVISQINFSPKTRVENHILFAGDSAGLITPLCGNGMSIGLHASKILSNLILKYLAGELTREMLEREYEIKWKKIFETRLTIGRLIQYSFGKEGITDTMIGTLKYFPSVVSKLESMTHGKNF